MRAAVWSAIACRHLRYAQVLQAQYLAAILAHDLDLVTELRARMVRHALRRKRHLQRGLEGAEHERFAFQRLERGPDASLH